MEIQEKKMVHRTKDMVDRICCTMPTRERLTLCVAELRIWNLPDAVRGSPSCIIGSLSEEDGSSRGTKSSKCGRTRCEKLCALVGVYWDLRCRWSKHYDGIRREARILHNMLKQRGELCKS